MEESAWRPLGVETEDDVAEYDALHDGVPNWMAEPYWRWVRDSVTVIRRYADGSGRVPMLNTDLAEHMCQALRIPLPNLRATGTDAIAGDRQFVTFMDRVRKHGAPLQIADYLLAHGQARDADELAGLLSRSKSAWSIGMRQGKPGLVRRVPLGVQVSADAAMARAGRAGVRLAKAWEALYGLEPDAALAYSLAIKAVEDAAIPVVSPEDSRATLGTVLARIEQQGDWSLPMGREHEAAPSGKVLGIVLRLLWHGQHDRHGGQPSAPGDVSIAEATVAVSLAVTLVNVFSDGLVSRSSSSRGRD